MTVEVITRKLDDRGGGLAKINGNIRLIEGLALPELTCSYIHVPRMRGQQLKEVSQLDGWLRDGSKDYIDSICQCGDETRKK
jgi:hypothetical protein